MGQMFVKDINSWRGLVYEKRWGTVAHAVHNAIKRQHVLQWGWSLDSWNAGATGKSKSNMAERVDQAVTDPFLVVMNDCP